MKRKLSSYEVNLALMMIEAKIASGSHEAVDIALEMVNDLLTDPRVNHKVRESFPNEVTVLEIQRDSREYLMMWRTYMNMVDTLERRVANMQNDEDDA